MSAPKTDVIHRAGEGPTVVLLHGAGGNGATWEATLPVWTWADVWCPDLPGRGHSPEIPCDRAEAAAEWLMGLARDHGWRRPILVGHSYGGAVALSAALAYPELIGGVVMVSSGGRLRVSPQVLAAVAEATEAAPFALDFAFGPTIGAPCKAQYLEAAAQTPPRATAADWQACNHFDVLDRLGELKVPLLVVHGDADGLTPPKHQARLQVAVPGASREVVPEVGHMLPWEAPLALAQAVRRWLGAAG